MSEAYNKIQTVWLRDIGTKNKHLLENQWSLPEFEMLKDIEWVFTEKIDGTNIRVLWDGEKVRFRGRDENSQIYAKLIDELSAMFYPDKLRAADIPPGMTFYGEGYGEGIGDGKKYCPGYVDFILFDVFCDVWLERHNVEEIAKKLEIDVVPIVGRGTLMDAIEMCKTELQSQVSELPRLSEGLICRPVVELLTRRGERIITKIKLKDFDRNKLVEKTNG